MKNIMTIEDAFNELNHINNNKKSLLKEAVETKSICPKCGSRNVTFINKTEEADPTDYFGDDIEGEELRTEYYYSCNNCGCNYKDIAVEMHASEILQGTDNDEFKPEDSYGYHIQVTRDHIGYSLQRGTLNPEIAEYFDLNQQDLEDYAKADYEYNKNQPTSAQVQQSMQAILAAHKFVLEDDNFWDNEIYSLYKIPRTDIYRNKIDDLRIACKNAANIN